MKKKRMKPETYDKMEKKLTGQDKRRVVEFLNKQKRVELAYLFGSVAEGKEGKLSDVDLAVFLDESLSKLERFNLQLKLISELTGILKTDRIDLVIMNDAPLTLNYEIIKANHPLLVRDEGQKIDFERVLEKGCRKRNLEWMKKRKSLERLEA
jgi:predicted nucleotidyltransferase